MSHGSKMTTILVGFLIFPLRFAANTAVQSSARPCGPPALSAAGRRSPRRPWAREPCCAGPPAGPEPTSRSRGKPKHVFSNSDANHSKLCVLTCVVRIISYSSSLGGGGGGGAGAGSGFLTMESCLRLPRRLLYLALAGADLPSCALWSSSRRACAVATRSKNSSFCSEVMEEKTTGRKEKRAENGRSR